MDDGRSVTVCFCLLLSNSSVFDSKSCTHLYSELGDGAYSSYSAFVSFRCLLLCSGLLFFSSPFSLTTHTTRYIGCVVNVIIARLLLASVESGHS